MMNRSWNHFDADEDKRFNPLDYNTYLVKNKMMYFINIKVMNSKKIKVYSI